MIYAITKFILLTYVVTAMLSASYIYAKRKSFELAATLVVNENVRHKGLSKTEIALLKGVRLSRLLLIGCVVIMIFIELVRLARF
jgi:hypothetical protein